MNRSVRRGMVGVAGLAVLGVTATLAGAQTDEVKEKPSLAAAGAHPAAFTLNDVVQAPFASYLLAAPTGGAVAWVFNARGCSNIWVADPSRGAKARRITPYTEDDGFDIGELAWSPDTKSIAFTRGQSLEEETPTNVNNFPQGPMPKEVWVVATAGGVPHKVGAGNSPSFSPDGSRLLFVDKKRILTVAASGDGDAQPGSVFHTTTSANNDVSSATNLFWTNHDDLVFPWEKSGWLHLYAVPVRGGAARALTMGKFEVTHFVFSQDRKRLVYSSTQDDTDRMHIWTVDAEHGSAVRTAQSHAIEDFPQIGADGTLFALQSDGNQPLHPVALSAGGQWRRKVLDRKSTRLNSSHQIISYAVF